MRRYGPTCYLIASPAARSLEEDPTRESRAVKCRGGTIRLTTASALVGGARPIPCSFAAIVMLIIPMDLSAKLDIRPTVDDAKKLFEQTRQATPRPTLLPICITLPSDLLTPSAIYLKLSAGWVTMKDSTRPPSNKITQPTPADRT